MQYFGKVINQAGNPITGATVQIFDPTGEVTPLHAASGPDGYFYLTWDYDLTGFGVNITAPGFSQSGFQITDTNLGVITLEGKKAGFSWWWLLILVPILYKKGK